MDGSNVVVRIGERSFDMLYRLVRAALVAIDGEPDEPPR